MSTAPAEVIRPLRRVEYDRLVALGVFEDERVELLDGALYAMSPIGIPHNFAVQELNELLVLALRGRARCGRKCPLRPPSCPSPSRI